MRTILAFVLGCFILGFLNLTLTAQDKVIKKEVTPTQEEQDKLKDQDPKTATYPTLENFKKEFKSLSTFKKKFLPAPIAYTDPNIGYSFGVGLGVILYDKDEQIRHLIAPYLHYNQNTKEGVTGRYIFMPTEKERYYYKISKSVKIDEEYLFEYINKKFYFEKFSFAALADIYQNGTARFFGIGRDTQKPDKLNYDNSTRKFQLKGGYIVNSFLDINLQFEYTDIHVKRGADSKLAQVVDAYAGDSLIRTSSYFASSIDLGFNLLGDGDEKVESVRLDFRYTDGVTFLHDGSNYQVFDAETKWFKQFHEKWSFAGSLSYQEVYGNNLPFYILSSLGGSRSNRGYELGRFYDSISLVGMAELRWKFYQLKKFGFTTDWELALFYDYGQVAQKVSAIDFQHLQHTVGIGIRTHFAANVLTRVDVGYSEEGLKVFVDFGYPF